MLRVGCDAVGNAVGGGAAGDGPVIGPVRVPQVLLWLMVVLVMPMLRVLPVAPLGAGPCVAWVWSWSWSWSLAGVGRGPPPFLAEGLAGGVAGSLW